MTGQRCSARPAAVEAVLESVGVASVVDIENDDSAAVLVEAVAHPVLALAAPSHPLRWFTFRPRTTPLEAPRRSGRVSPGEEDEVVLRLTRAYR
jgi:hypothetical protein